MDEPSWPLVATDLSSNSAVHAAELGRCFDDTLRHAQALVIDSTNQPAFPEGLGRKIFEGISKGLRDALSAGLFPYNVDLGELHKVLLENVTNEAALESQKAVPLLQFQDLNKSYQQLLQKIQSPPRDNQHPLSSPRHAAAQPALGRYGVHTAPTSVFSDPRTASSSPHFNVNSALDTIIRYQSTLVNGTQEEERDRTRQSGGSTTEIERDLTTKTQAGQDCSPRLSNDGVYSVVIHAFPAYQFDLDSRRGKAVAITSVLRANARLSILPDDISNIRIQEGAKAKHQAPIVIEFRNRSVANDVLQRGLTWLGKQWLCEALDQRLIMVRCGHCQGFWHQSNMCKLPQRCGRCSGAHGTSECRAYYVRCAACGGPHAASDAKCPAKLAQRRNVRFPTPEPPTNSPASRLHIPLGPSQTPIAQRAPYQPPHLRFPTYEVDKPMVKQEQEQRSLQIPPATHQVSRTRSVHEKVERLQAELQDLQHTLGGSATSNNKRERDATAARNELDRSVSDAKRAKTGHGPNRQSSHESKYRLSPPYGDILNY